MGLGQPSGKTMFRALGAGDASPDIQFACLVHDA